MFNIVIALSKIDGLYHTTIICYSWLTAISTWNCLALLVEGTNIRYKCKDEDTKTEVWYEGKVCSINGNVVSIEYVGYSDSFEWTRRFNRGF